MKVSAFVSFALAMAFTCNICMAQTAAPASSSSTEPPAATVGIVDNPCDTLLPPPEAPALAGPKRPLLPQSRAALAAASKAWEEQRLAFDFGGLCHYREANAKLPAATAHRVVFMGDSITQGWIDADPGIFTDDVLDRGVSGQTTPQMLVRFRQDVIDLHPAVVHILAGTNDIAGNTGPTTLQDIENNIQTMVELAQAHHIHVILATLTPAARYPWRPGVESVESIRALNDWIKTYAKQNGLTYVDYFTALDDGHRGFIAKLSIDGVHPNAQGYAVMDKLAREAIKQALSASP
ncbi:SGNH/GDSL hydrolase family protein [Dyella sp.]|uniref:SGNH/GDSL hydrolase family protein n=1 Tax=Dyella sp. TaxID=1869338 RepID=UPI002FDADC25